MKIRELSGCNKAALSGGVFQNRLLLELTDHMLLEQGFEVLKHQLLPPMMVGLRWDRLCMRWHIWKKA